MNEDRRGHARQNHGLGAGLGGRVARDRRPATRRGHAEGRRRPAHHLGKPDDADRSGHLQEARHRSGEFRHQRRRRDAAAVISGSADIGIGMGTSGAMRAFVKGAPVRMLAPAFTGSNDLYWYVKADSPIKSLQDTNGSQTIAYSTNGSSTNSLVIGFGKEMG